MFPGKARSNGRATDGGWPSFVSRSGEMLFCCVFSCFTSAVCEARREAWSSNGKKSHNLTKQAMKLGGGQMFPFRYLGAGWGNKAGKVRKMMGKIQHRGNDNGLVFSAEFIPPQFISPQFTSPEFFFHQFIPPVHFPPLQSFPNRKQWPQRPPQPSNLLFIGLWLMLPPETHGGKFSHAGLWGQVWRKRPGTNENDGKETADGNGHMTSER